MMPPLLKRAARIVPYANRVMGGLEAMRTHIAALEARNRDLERRLAKAQEAPKAEQAGIKAVHFIDRAWRDTAGAFVSGWAHAGLDAVRRVALRSGTDEAAATRFTAREDVSRFYPELPPGGAAGFELYLPCPGDGALVLQVQTDAGSLETAVKLPRMEEREEADGSGTTQAFVEAMQACGGTVMELGARVVGSMTQPWRERFGPTCRYIGCDIHAGPGIDLVADVHALGRQVEAGSLDGVFSIAVLEHLAAPWVAAEEINRALRVGGETVHVTHQTWPVHETPNDFFRMSDQALRSLFGAAAGFEVLEAGMAFPMAIVPPPWMRNDAWLQAPFGRGYGQSYIRARKVAEARAWGTEALERVSRAYPTRG